MPDPMSTVFVKIAPVLLTFALGVLLRRGGIFNKSNADLFLKLFFYVAAPALFLRAVPSLDLSIDLIAIPLSAVAIDFSIYGLAWLVGKRLDLERHTLGAFIIGAVIMNTGFLYPFALSVYGPEGMAIASLFDFGHASVAFSFIYINACRYGRGNDHTAALLFRKFISAPPLIALFAGLLLNLTNAQLPVVIAEFVNILSGLVTPLMMIPLGIYFEARIYRARPLVTAIILRMIGGFGVGLACTLIFDLQGLVRTMVLLLSAAPTGIMALTFSSMEELDGDMAASIVSYSTMIGLILTPVLIMLLPAG